MANTIHYGYVSSPKEVLEQCLNAYNSERLFCQILANNPEFNSCYVQHRRGYIKVTVANHYLAKGNFNLFKFIKTVTMPRDTETYVKAKKQLEIIHRNGIIHGDIWKANILYTKEGKVFIIDFASSIPENQSTDEINKESDKAALEIIFED
ncbi:DEHA2A01012p [Debaryomyces hansenii CBS767]|uniref:non-specific serine/threonine protein kinase n=1 Tax=Debaryomyces hansenii (strain ATCC 36239 / CBS 767 / BCRC 21394 / JCM 1990 / NBRC 0083 / IGC 2968) TaxID=284592 RepID=Q6BZI6_DEBHA|nr:DEHA2A01012p [Debaryomyces hansenii CBS767]CAG84330.1 DEHA2A01012p [Debaryomyces hansenii CBS767]|eukprot:XP_456383.1 DEHA2A01012p [Debaryomyces hansenii CBS767]